MMVLEAATIVLIVGLIYMRVRRGHLPTWAKWCALIGLMGLVPVNNVLNVYNKIGTVIKDLSNANHCTSVHTTFYDGKTVLGYAYEVTTVGSTCDNTAKLETIDAAVQKCATWLHSSNAIAGCCPMSHGLGGTWRGHLRLTSDPTNYPAKEVHCSGALE